MVFHGYESDDDVPLPYRDKSDTDDDGTIANDDDDGYAYSEDSNYDDEEDDNDEDDNAEVHAEENEEEAEGSNVVVVMDWNMKRKELISMLLDRAHDIHLLMGKTKKERCEKIWRKYASEFDEQLVVNSLSRCLLQLQKGELRDPGKATAKDGKPFWKDKKKSSKAHDLLYKIRLRPLTSRLSTKEVYERHEVFQEYAFNDFKEYDKRMIEIAKKHYNQAEQEAREWELQRAATTKRERTSRGKLFWTTHAANQQLIEDTKSGKTTEMKPAELYKSQSCYQEFSLDDFRKHIYQEKYKQLAGPYWQKKRNQMALRERLDEVDQMYTDFLHSNYKENLEAVMHGLERF